MISVRIDQYIQNVTLLDNQINDLKFSKIL